MAKDSKLTAIMLVQQLEDEHWESWDDKSSIEQARNGDCLPLLKAVIKKLNSADITVSEAYGIIHDKDQVPIWSNERQAQVLKDKAKHIHFLLKFQKGATLNKLALTIGVEPQYLEKLKSGRYGYDNCLAYLVHAKDLSKYQYEPSDVVTINGEDYTSIYNRQMPTWAKGRATKDARETNLSVDWLVAEILSGQLSKSQILLTDEYFKIYGQHKRKINEALDTAGERKSYQTIQDLNAGKFKKSVIFINADSGVGKTKLSKKLMTILQTIAKRHGQSWEYCITASTNAFDEYNGQELLLLDDIRGDSLTVSDWLKLLDPYMISPISARYHNKQGSARVIIITNPEPPITFFSKAKGRTSVDEDLGQFIRRIACLLTIDNNYTLSTHEKTPTDMLFKYYSYRFLKIGEFEENQALDKIVKMVLRNMQWDRKKATLDTDQSNKGSNK